jgi:DNA-binding CsgD family transcriptional regulator
VSRRDPVRTESRHAAALAGLVVLQSLCAAFFLADVLGDLGWPPRLAGLGPHVALEAAVAAALIVGVAFGARETRRVLERQARAEDALAAASGAFATLLDAHFERWGLTPAERDVALLSIKGLEIAEIAALRGAAQGTVRSQCARVYAKAGVGGRAQLLGLFIEELMDGAMAGRAPQG